VAVVVAGVVVVVDTVTGSHRPQKSEFAVVHVLLFCI
jgi:hypothetical protein